MTRRHSALSLCSPSLIVLRAMPRQSKQHVLRSESIFARVVSVKPNARSASALSYSENCFFLVKTSGANSVAAMLVRLQPVIMQVVTQSSPSTTTSAPFSALPSNATARSAHASSNNRKFPMHALFFVTGLVFLTNHVFLRLFHDIPGTLQAKAAFPGLSLGHQRGTSPVRGLRRRPGTGARAAPPGGKTKSGPAGLAFLGGRGMRVCANRFECNLFRRRA